MRHRLQTIAAISKYETKDYAVRHRGLHGRADLQPTNAVIQFNLGNAHYRITDYPAALTAFDQALSLDSNFMEALNNRGISNVI